MTFSRHHTCLKDLVAHYLSPLHLFSPVICCACRTRYPALRGMLFGIVRGYDRLYKSLLTLQS